MSLRFFPAPSPKGTGILILPGGGYGFISEDNEGLQPAKWLNERGFDAWVLAYTCASNHDDGSVLYPLPQQEAVAAVRKIQSEKRVRKLGIWGWSAGGHLAAITATSQKSVTLDFLILVYGVLSMEFPTTHTGSRDNLLGPNPSDELVREMSAQNRVSEVTPPTFIFHTANDPAVPVQNSLQFATAMAEHKRPFQIYVLPNGPHGIGLALGDPALTWTAELDRWLRGIVKD